MNEDKADPKAVFDHALRELGAINYTQTGDNQ